ncbi:MAG: hypothetical protein WCR30_03295 [Clostridia bacterium]
MAWDKDATFVAYFLSYLFFAAAVVETQITANSNMPKRDGFSILNKKKMVTPSSF